MLTSWPFSLAAVQIYSKKDLSNFISIGTTLELSFKWNFTPGLPRFRSLVATAHILGSFGERLLINGLHDVFSKNELDLQIQSGKSYVTATGDRIEK